MRKEILYKASIFAISCLLFSSCFLPISSTTVSGRVTDYDKKPIVDAEVSFGGTGMETTTKTDAEGKFTVTARHRPSQMLYLQVKKAGFAMKDKMEFPGFAVPDKPVEIQIIQTIPSTR